MDQNNTVTRIILQSYDNLPSAPRKDKAIKTEEIADFLTIHKDEMALHFLEDHLKKELTSGSFLISVRGCKII